MWRDTTTRGSVFWSHLECPVPIGSFVFFSHQITSIFSLTTCHSYPGKRLKRLVFLTLYQVPTTCYSKMPQKRPPNKAPPTRVAGRCSPAEGRKATTCFYPALFSSPRFTSLQAPYLSLRHRRQSPFPAPHRLSTPEHFAGSEGGFAKQRAHGLNTPLQRTGRGTDATLPSKGRHGAAQGQQRGETQEPPSMGGSHQLHLRPLFHGRFLRAQLLSVVI